LKRFNLTEVNRKNYLYNFYKYGEGSYIVSAFLGKMVRANQCDFNNYSNNRNLQSAYNDIINKSTNIDNAVSVDNFGRSIVINKNGQFTIFGTNDKYNIGANPDKIYNKMGGTTPHKYILFAINGNNIEGFFIGNCIVNNKGNIRFIDITDENITIAHNDEAPLRVNKELLISPGQYLLNKDETEQYLNNYRNKSNNDSFKGRWLVFKLDNADECKNAVAKSKTVKNSNTLSIFGFGGNRKTKSKSKKYARKTIRKHKSRKNRN